MIVLLASLVWAAEPPTLRVPVGEPSADWELVARGVGLRVVTDGPADITLQQHGEGWTLVVVDSGGERHQVTVRAPRNRTDRETIAWIGRNLMDPVEVSAPPAAVEPDPETLGGHEPPRQRWAVGFSVGAPTGLAVRADLSPSDRWSVDARVGVAGTHWVWTQATLKVTVAQLLPEDAAARLSVRTGLGGTLAGRAGTPRSHRSHGPWVGIHAPAGLALQVGRLEVFGDVSPTVLPSLGAVHLPVAVGARVGIGRHGSDPNATAAPLSD